MNGHNGVNVYAVQAPESVQREQFEQVLRNRGLTDEDVAQMNDMGFPEVMMLADVEERDLFRDLFRGAQSIALAGDLHSRCTVGRVGRVAGGKSCRGEALKLCAAR
jgi:hypothetical protein